MYLILKFGEDPCSIQEVMSMCPITHVPHCLCAPSPMCPIPHGAPSISAVLTKIPLYPYAPLPMCPIAHVPLSPKLSKRCQIVTKMSNVKKSNTWPMEEVHKKIN